MEPDSTEARGLLEQALSAEGQRLANERQERENQRLSQTDNHLPLGPSAACRRALSGGSERG